MSSSLFLFSLLFLLGTTISSARFLFRSPIKFRHIITFHTSTPLQPSSLAWDPISEHFFVGSMTGPTLHAISYAGAVERLISESSATGANASATSIAIDHIHRRLIVAFSNPFSVAAYDLISYRRIFAVLLPEMDTTPGGVAVDLRNGEAFVSSFKRGVVWKVGLEGTVRVVSVSKIYGDQGLGGLVHVSRGRGYLLVVQPITRKIFKVDSDDGAAKELLSSNNSKLLKPAGHATILDHHLSIVVTSNKTLLLMKYDDRWSQAAVRAKSDQVEQGATVVAVAIREGSSAYVLLKLQEQYRIERVLCLSPYFDSKKIERVLWDLYMNWMD